jgi:hypothetical protein
VSPPPPNPCAQGDRRLHPESTFNDTLLSKSAQCSEVNRQKHIRQKQSFFLSSTGKTGRWIVALSLSAVWFTAAIDGQASEKEAAAAAARGSQATASNQPLLFQPPKQSYVLSVDYSRCPKARELASKIVQICDHYYPLIRALLAVPANWATDKLTIVLNSNGPHCGVNGSTLSLNANWLSQHPDDFGCVIWQLAVVLEDNYAPPRPDCKEPRWLVFGIADYARAKLSSKSYSQYWCAGCDAGETPRTSSKCGAAFLIYLEQKYAS